MGEGKEDNEAGTGETTNKASITLAVNNSPLLKQYLNTLYASDSSNPNINSRIAGYQDVIRRLAFQNRISGDSDESAASNAVSAITKNYQFYGHARIPINVASNVIQHIDYLKNTISEKDIQIPENYTNTQEYMNDVKRNSEVVTNKNENGVNFITPDGKVVRDKTGRNLTVPFTVQLGLEERAAALTEEQEKNAPPVGSTAAVAGM